MDSNNGDLPDRLNSGRTSLGVFTGRVLVVGVIAVLAVALWQLTDVLVLLFGAVLLAIGLNAAAKAVSRLTAMGSAPALVIVIGIGLVAFAAALWVFGATVAAQLDEVIKTGPAGVQLAVDWVNGHSELRQFLDQARGTNIVGATGWATSIVASAIRSVTRVFGYGIITFFVAIYLAAQPDRYRRLCIRLGSRLIKPTRQRSPRGRLKRENSAQACHSVWLCV